MNQTAWIIDKDHLFEAGDDPSDDESGITGPQDAPAELLDSLRASKAAGVPFRMRDDDGILYYTGRIIALNDDGTQQTWDSAGEEFFRPLWDFGTPNAGAVDIQYRTPDGAWTGL